MVRKMIAVIGGSECDEKTIELAEKLGEAIAKKITQLVTTGKMDLYEKVRSEFPQGVIDLMEVPGIGPKLAARLYTELHITNIDELKSALWDGRVASLPRVGEKIAQNILRSIEPNR